MMMMMMMMMMMSNMFGLSKLFPLYPPVPISIHTSLFIKGRQTFTANKVLKEAYTVPQILHEKRTR